MRVPLDGALRGSARFLQGVFLVLLGLLASFVRSFQGKKGRKERHGNLTIGSPTSQPRYVEYELFKKKYILHPRYETRHQERNKHSEAAQARAGS